MAFRADEAANKNFERAKNYLIPRSFSGKVRRASENALLAIVDELGPVVDAYPSWHPLVSKHSSRSPETTPGERCGYVGLDHTVYFAHGFLTCPYTDGSKVIDSANAIKHHFAEVFAEKLDAKFYNEASTPVLVKCEWPQFSLNSIKLIRKRCAVPLMIEQELPIWTWSKNAEQWSTMRPYLLGDPHGSRSSLFVDQETALAIKKIYLSMVESGMFGPLSMD